MFSRIKISKFALNVSELDIVIEDASNMSVKLIKVLIERQTLNEMILHWTQRKCQRTKIQQYHQEFHAFE